MTIRSTGFGACEFFLIFFHSFRVLVLTTHHRSYKYHSRALVFNTKNMIRLWDIG
jgi:hypothetical protein